MKLKALVIIANEDCYDLIPKILVKSESPFYFIMHGSGIADSVILDYLGLIQNKKLVALSIAFEKNVPLIYKMLEHHMQLSSAGKGIAFSVDIDTASAALSKAYKAISENGDGNNNNDKGGFELMESKIDNSTYELVVTVAERGSFDEIKAAAKAAGVRGGTLIHGLGMGSEKSEKFFGISIQPEKDIVMIITKKEESKDVMKSILEAVGLSTDHKGICFSLPVDNVFGLASKIEVESLKLD